ncbi:RecX family transcriptional regulator [Fructilactobacillus vespulae]|uniref:RecX family transcriptional regulator n=1 Tax=Fructilactobacillus vespulae TaxID=1249630 RepID=UPI0039B4BE80
MAKNSTYKITKIEAQKRPGRYNVYLNDEYAFPISEEAMIKYRIFKGTILTKQNIADLKYSDSIYKLIGKAVNFISYRTRTEKEIKDKLGELTEDQTVIEKVLDHLQKMHLIDDENYANTYTEQIAAGQNKGPMAIKQYLMKKGISEDIIITAIDNYYSDSKIQENATKVAQQQFDHYNRYPYNKRIEKVKLSMVRKGFSFSDIDNALVEIDDQVDNQLQDELLVKEGNKLLKRYQNEDDFKKTQKLKQALFRKGFSFDDIDEFLEGITK